MSSWRIGLLVRPEAMKILVVGWDGDLLKAHLPPNPAHPGALVTLLEGLSLWAGTPLLAAVSVGDACHPSSVDALFGGDALYADSPLVTFNPVFYSPNRRRIRGLGDFRAVQRTLRAGA